MTSEKLPEVPPPPDRETQPKRSFFLSAREEPLKSIREKIQKATGKSLRAPRRENS
ncbi:MAG: hypothetical protein UV80_C0006G0058 [Candidatus Peregrinibacteria bacterium GW2011_GWF2_43_17]|nr:MAG: hypothetical protein UV80_C0006G0058 [Candidatus Peregrinibacteria bacterium GW2011_GWF2_43_17]KKT19584.1 MAG: hypothetical protein UW03_C0016G0041 [Candidatus Peregrinibacteria bacterium GW2011_GWA2_43_8]